MLQQNRTWNNEGATGEGASKEERRSARARLQLIGLLAGELSPSLSVACTQRLEIGSRSTEEHGAEEACEGQQEGEEVDQST